MKRNHKKGDCNTYNNNDEKSKKNDKKTLERHSEKTEKTETFNNKDKVQKKDQKTAKVTPVLTDAKQEKRFWDVESENEDF
jgi:hypothetical protein